MKKLTNSEKQRIVHYAHAMQDLMLKLTGDNTCAKSYDPITIEDDTIHSYAFNFLNGGRHHPISEFESVEQIIDLMLE